MVADEGERDDANGFENTSMYEDTAAQLAAGFGRNAETLGNDRDDDYCHTYKGKARGFCELRDSVSRIRMRSERFTYF